MSLKLVRDTEYQKTLTTEEWANLCRFLKMDLADVLKLTGPELLKATMLQIRKNGREFLLSTIGPSPSDGWASTPASSSRSSTI